MEDGTAKWIAYYYELCLTIATPSLLCSVCLGMHVADSTIFIAVATTLAICNVAPVMEDDRVVHPAVKQTSGMVRQVLQNSVPCLQLK